MAYDFTRSVQDPRDIYPQGYGATQDSTAAAVGTALSGLANIFDMGIKYAAEQKTDQRLADFENEIAPYQQAVAQGRMESNDAFARTTAKIKSYIDRYPTLADDLRKRAQDIWGVNPAQEVSRLAIDTEAQKRKRQQDADNASLQVANEFGAIPLDEKTGAPDLEAGVLVGREISAHLSNIQAASAEADLELKRRRLAGEGDESLSDTLKRREIVLGDAIGPLINDAIAHHVRNVPALIGTLENPKDADSLAAGQRMVEASYNNTREQVSRILNETPGLDYTTRSNLLKMVDDAYESYRGRTPNTIANAEKIINFQTSTVRGAARRAMPDVMAAIDIFGQGIAQEAGRSLFLAPTAGGAAYRVDRDQRVAKFWEGLVNIANGTPSPTDPNDRQSAIDQANGARAAVDKASRNPEAVNDKSLPAVGNTLSFVIDKALESQDPDDYLAAMESSNNAGMARNLERLKTQNPELYENTVQKIIILNSNGILSLGARAQETAVSGSILDQIGRGLNATESGGEPPSARERSAVGLVYNAELGLVEIAAEKAGVKSPPTLVRLRDAMNRSLTTILRYKDHMPDNTKDASDQEIKFALMTGAGIQIKGKTPETLEDEKKSTE